MKLIRNVLIMTMNTDWAKDIKVLFEGHKKIKIDIATTRSSATKMLSEKDYAAFVFEDTFKVKNVNFVMRSLMSGNISVPELAIISFVEFASYQEVEIPVGIACRPYALSGPVEQVHVAQVLKQFLLPIGERDDEGVLDREFFEILISSANHTLTGLGVFNDLKAQKPSLLTKMSSPPTVAISGKIIIKSEFFSGSMFISFSNDSYLKLYSAVTGTQATEINGENQDFAGEIANMVYGHTKKILEKQGVSLNMAIPVTDLSSAINSKNPVFVIPIETALGPIWIQLAINSF